jgi:hypothetical protein
MTANGRTIDEIAAFLNVDRVTIFRWAKKYDGVKEALRKGRYFQAEHVIETLFKRANGYDIEETKQVVITSGVDKLGKPKRKVRIEKTTKHLPGDVGAITFLLKNVRPREFRDKWDIEQTGSMDLKLVYDNLAVIDLLPEEIDKVNKNNVIKNAADSTVADKIAVSKIPLENFVTKNQMIEHARSINPKTT